MINDRPLFIYLDQNKWIDLARAYHDKPDGNKFKSVLQKVNEAVESKKAIFPLSGYHVAETKKNLNSSRRQLLAKVMATISQGWTMSLSEDISIAEMQISGAKIFDYTPPQLPPIFGHGINFALGIDSRSLIAKSIIDPVAMSEDFINVVDTFTSTPTMTEWILGGYGNSESELTEAKNDYEKGLATYVETTERYRAQLKPHLQSEIGHKKLYIANLQVILRRTINDALSTYNVTLDDIISMGENKLIDFFEGTPTVDTEIQLITRRNANWNKAIDKNDLADVSVLTIAIPYCDIVITENSWKDLAVRSNLDKKYNTVVISDVNELNGYL